MYGERDKSLKKTLGKNAKAARLRQDMTQADVAERLELATEVYGRIERGRSFPSMPTFWRLCHVLHESADKMLGLPTPHGTGDWLAAEPFLTYDPKHPADLRRLIRTLEEMNNDEWKAIRRLILTLKRNIR